jgi:hypothetical protein
MWNRFFKTNYQRISFEDVQRIIQRPDQYTLMNTLPMNEQGCLIQGTLPFHQEENRINEYLDKFDYQLYIVLYGKHTLDISVEKKYDQLIQLGFSHVFIYSGGIFEWMLLQDIYGKEEFPTTANVLDILKFKPQRTISAI